MSSQIVIVGGGGHARSVIDVIEAEGRFDIAGVVDPKPPSSGSLMGYPWLGDDEALGPLIQRHKNAVIAIGQLPQPDKRIELFERVSGLGAQLPVIISPSAVVSPHATIGRGSIVMHGAVINAGAIIGENCIVNTLALVEHDSRIGDHCHVATGARINGECVLGRESFVGSGAIVFQQVHLPARSVVGAGTIVKTAAHPKATRTTNNE
jgi:sugar O-acyltransferase (sialic acid O-acetyltransferase NeuD family)